MCPQKIVDEKLIILKGTFWPVLELFLTHNMNWVGYTTTRSINQGFCKQSILQSELASVLLNANDQADTGQINPRVGQGINLSVSEWKG